MSNCKHTLKNEGRMYELSLDIAYNEFITSKIILILINKTTAGECKRNQSLHDFNYGYYRQNNGALQKLLNMFLKYNLDELYAMHTNDFNNELVYYVEKEPDTYNMLLYAGQHHRISIVLSDEFITNFKKALKFASDEYERIAANDSYPL